MRTTTNERTIMVPLDGSALAEQVMPLAVSLARATRSRLQLVHVHQLPLWPDEAENLATMAAMRRILHAEEESYLRGVQQRFEGSGLCIETSVLQGDQLPVAQALGLHVQEGEVDLVVMATHGHGGVHRAWLGSVADYLVRHLAVPIILARAGASPMPGGRQLMVPLDGSALAEAILDEACLLAKSEGRELLLLRVVQPIMQTLTSLEAPYVGVDSELTAMHRSAAEDYLDDIEDRVRARGVACSSLAIVAASPAECIISVARPDHIGLIAMASHGRGGIRRLVLGSVADKVVRGADVPVLVLRPMLVNGLASSGLARVRHAGPTSCSL